MTKTVILSAVLAAFVSAGYAEENDEQGTLNPDEMSLSRQLRNAQEGETSMTICASGYLMTKSGQHEMARELFLRCVEDGYTGAMTWMSYLEDNGFGAPMDPDRAAEYDRMAAEAGDPIGMFNYGLDMMRGRGAPLDEEAGRALVDQAAELGFEDAERLRASGYDLDEVTPDADNWKYAPVF
ncbi:tetratricopeptide repeat protein [Marivivens aquimaris]|uniref:tetratricopeptide repeat protein n=1 Tax=Marivivens aquimaris TaxID=2774876 RepID=UPI0018817298|nr:sel1 repeat family protein [Marivivens aquimaris]